MSRPDSALAHFVQGNRLQVAGELDAAIASYDLALAERADFAECHANRAVALVGLIRVTEALASFDSAICLRPDFAEAYFGRAVAGLLAGDYARGWRDFEWRWLRTSGPARLQRRDYTQPRWSGHERLAGKAILVYSEIGLGDTLQFCRYVTLLAALRASVILQVQAPLVPVLSGLAGVAHVIAEGQPPPAFDYHCPVLSLPLAFKTTLDTIPAPCRYLHADPARVAQWRTRMGVDDALRVGLVWRGDPGNPDDARRSMPLELLVAQLPRDVRYFSLQKNVTDEEQQFIDGRPELSCLATELGFMDTAAVCECLDLIVSVDTSAAHLSAALGRPTGILLPFSPDCRWLLGRADSPWYPSARLYRQITRGDWQGPLAQAAADIKKRGAGVD